VLQAIESSPKARWCRKSEAVNEGTEMQRWFAREKSGGVKFQTSFTEGSAPANRRKCHRLLLIGSKIRSNRALRCRRGFLESEALGCTCGPRSVRPATSHRRTLRSHGQDSSGRASGTSAGRTEQRTEFPQRQAGAVVVWRLTDADRRQGIKSGHVVFYEVRMCSRVWA
jgi:hypothetical protein